MANMNQTQTGYAMGDVNRNNQMIQPIQYPNYMFNPLNYNYNRPQSNVQSQFLKCRPVSSREEAIASQIDLDGSLWVFPNVGNGKIYTKQISNDGTAIFNTYSFTEEETPSNNPTEFVTKEEFNKVIQTLAAAIQPHDASEPAAAKTPLSF